jgi:AbrB family looped-hinge helix DNA binding protein
MTTVTLTSKGQITIPADVRSRLGVEAGDRLEFVELAGGGFVIQPAIDDVRSLKGLLPKPAKPVSLAAMDAAIRGRAGIKGNDRN